MSARGLTTTWRWAVRTAWRDARGAKAKALIYALSMALGIAALVAMGSFGSDLNDAIQNQTRDMMGADLSFSSRQPFNREAAQFFEEIPGESSNQVQFAGMAFFPKAEAAHLSRVRAIEGGFPFYGTLETSPPQAAQDFRQGQRALVERTLAERVGVDVGDSVRLGQVDFTIVGILEAAPGEAPISAMMGPRIYIPMAQLEATKLVQPGSRVFYSMGFRLPDGFNADRLVKSREADLRQWRIRATTVKERREQMGEAVGNAKRFLSLVACIALLLGGLGVAGAVYYHVKQKYRQMAVMRCIGANVKQVTLVYLLQVTAMSMIAIVLGIGLGVGLQFMLPKLVQALLPFEFQPSFQVSAVVIAVAWGLLMSLLPAAAPLAGIRRIKPLSVFRVGLSAAGRDWLQWSIYAVILLVWWAFAVVQMESFKLGAAFIGALLGGLLLLLGTAAILSRLARGWLSPRLPFAWRFGLASLFRPHNQTAVLTLVLGMGVFLITVLAGARGQLLNQFDYALGEDRPNFIAFDIQNHQATGVRETVSELGFDVRQMVPMVSMRLESVKGIPIAELEKSEEFPRWILRREYRSTYRAEISPTEELLAGAWVARADMNQERIPVSLEDEIAESLQLNVGDGFRVDVLGLPLDLEVANLRRVDWQSMQPNFYMVFPEGVLEDAPQMHILATRTEGPDDVARLQNALVKAYPNVSCVDMTEIASTIEALMVKAGAVVRFLAWLCIGVGILLLANTIWNARYQRMGEYALLRTLGAKRAQMIRMTMAEYFLLGLFASVTGVLLAAAANWAVGRFLFNLDSMPDLWTTLLPLVFMPMMTLLLGVMSHRAVWRVAPSRTLAEER